MLKTGKYQFVSFGGAIKHPNHQPQQPLNNGDKIGLYGQLMDMVIKTMVRAMIHQQKPDILWFMTDPRFYELVMVY